MNEHANFVEDVTDEDYEHMKEELCEASTRWESSSHKGLVLRQKLQPEVKLWATFINRRILPTSHNSTVNRTRLALIHSIMNKRTINVGELIINELYKCAKKDRGPLSFPSMVTSLCTAATVTIEDTDEYTPLRTDEYTPLRKGWDRETCLKLIQITEADPVQATPMTGTIGVSYSTAVPPIPQSATPAENYQLILQELEDIDIRQRCHMEEMDNRQRRYMEYTQDFNASLTQMLQ